LVVQHVIEDDRIAASISARTAGAIESRTRRNTGPNLAVTLTGSPGGDVVIISTPSAVKASLSAWRAPSAPR
jgi:hypothetical protein